MKKVRIYELSKQLGISNKDLMNLLKDKFGFEAKSHSSSIDEDIVEKVLAASSVKQPPPKEDAPSAPQKSRVETRETDKRQPETRKPQQEEQQRRPQQQGEYQRRPQQQGEQQRRPQQQGEYQRRPQQQGEQQRRPQQQGEYQRRPQQQGEFQRRPQQQGDQQRRPQQQGEYQRRPQQQGEYQRRPPQQGDQQRRPQQQGDQQRRPNQFEKKKQEEPLLEMSKPVSRRSSQGKPGRPGASKGYGQGDDKSKEAGPKKSRKRTKNDQFGFYDGSSATIGEKIDKDKKDQKDQSMLMTKSFPRPEARKKVRGGREKNHRAPEVTKKESVQKWLELPDNITVGELADKLGIAANEIIKELMKSGVMAGINQVVSFETAAQIAKAQGFKVEKTKEEEVAPEEVVEDISLLRTRPPVVTVLGHVDHGKTSLLDAIRNTNVTASESGGITQSIGASTVEVNERRIVFVDTPGHEAFTAMRARGAKVTDIAVLVVAADDGVMPQTVEAINHARAAEVPIIVAINKIDKADSNPEKVKQQLTEFNLLAEDWGGETVMVPVSAKSRMGIDELLEMILLVADMSELKANPSKNASGIIIESRLDKGFGPVATVIVQNGSLKVGDAVIVGNEWGKVRFMMNDRGKRVKKVMPSFPAEIIGLSGVPNAGDLLQVINDEKIAKTISEERKLQVRTDKMQATSRVSLDDLFRQMKEGETKELKIIIKAESNGSVEALKHSLVRLSNPDVKITVIHDGVGAISESDVVLAAASNAIIIGFNVRPDPLTKRLAEQEKIDVRMYRVIYNAIDDVKAAMSGLLEPEYEEVFMGRVEVRNTFKVSRIGVIAGCYVLEGKINRNTKIRVLRDNIVVHEGKLSSLRRFKDDVSEVSAGYECGIFIDKFPAFQEGDIIEAYTIKEVKREMAAPTEPDKPIESEGEVETEKV
jgi:translation initiation factor IF-2